jgi:hypothetical protein
MVIQRHERKCPGDRKRYVTSAGQQRRILTILTRLVMERPAINASQMLIEAVS